MTPEQIDTIARAGFEVSNAPQSWDALKDHERERWRHATAATTAEDARDTYFTGYYGMLEWDHLTPKSRETWKRITTSMLLMRMRLGLPTVTSSTPRHPLIRTVETIAS